MSRPRGGYIGHNAAPAAAALNSAASGVWTLREAESLRRAGTWPIAPPGGVGAGLQLWLDASDASTLYNATTGGSLVAADGGVARWEDKSGNARHATQGTSANRPARKTAIQGGLDVLRFDGSDDSLSIPSSTETFKFLHGGSTGYTAFAVVSPRALNTRERIFETGRWGSPSGDAGGIGASWNIDTNGSFRYDAAAGATSVIANASPTSAIAAGSWYVLGVSGIANSATAALRSSMRINGGTAIANNTQTGAASTNNARTDLTIARGIGYNGDGSVEYEQFADLDIAEIIIYDSALSDANRELVENYLLAKWGIA